MFSKIDLKLGYHQPHSQEVDIHYIAFSTWYGNYEFMIVPFGLTNVPTVFISLMNGLFCKYLDWCVIVFLDDILIYLKIVEEHEVHLC